MNAQLKFIASMSLWFTIGLMVSVLLYKPKLIGINFSDPSAKNVNKVDILPVRSPSRFISTSKYKHQKI